MEQAEQHAAAAEEERLREKQGRELADIEAETVRSELADARAAAEHEHAQALAGRDADRDELVRQLAKARAVADRVRGLQSDIADRDAQLQTLHGQLVEEQQRTVQQRAEIERERELGDRQRAQVERVEGQLVREQGRVQKLEDEIAQIRERAEEREQRLEQRADRLEGRLEHTTEQLQQAQDRSTTLTRDLETAQAARQDFERPAKAKAKAPAAPRKRTPRQGGGEAKE